ncbi:hypothetical protein CLAIMM_06626 [Cladophialophora immunda]|nr:hypothetical protein CLAIMM_06626 [Cladophialophora immunda]
MNGTDSSHYHAQSSPTLPSRPANCAFVSLMASAAGLLYRTRPIYERQPRVFSAVTSARSAQACQARPSHPSRGRHSLQPFFKSQA